MKRRILLVLFCCLLTVFGLASADDFLIQDLIKKNSGTSILIKAPIDYISTENVNVSLKENNTSLAIKNVASVTDSQEVFTSWYFVLDVPQERENTVNYITEALIKRMKPGDNAQVVNATQGETIVETLTDNTEILNNTIKEITKKVNARNTPALSEAVNAVLEKSDFQKRDRTCVVLISGFTNDYNANYDRLEGNLKATKASLYLVQVNIKNPNSSLINKFLGIVDRLGTGASIKLKDNKENAAQQARNEIDEQERKYKVVTVDDNGFENSGTLVVTITQNLRSYTAEYLLGEASSPVPTPSPDSTPEPTPEPKPIWERIIQYIKDNPVNSAFFGVVFVLVIILICLLIRGAAKKRQETREKKEVTQEESKPQKTALIHSEISKPMSDVSEMISQINQSETNGYVPTEIDPMRNQNANYGLEVSVVSADGRFRSIKRMTNTMALGRNPEANLGYNPERTDMRFPEDYGKISNCHALLTYEHGVMYIEDVSRNGTWINGTRVNGRVPIKSGSNLTLGRADFQIMWN